MKQFYRIIIWNIVFCTMLFILTMPSSFASNINMNHIEENVTEQVENLDNSSVSTTNSTNTDATSTNTQSTTSSSNLPSSTSTTVSSILPESDLGLANILNILLITVGVILILLAIAILIRLK